jgi:hypothetical protein
MVVSSGGSVAAPATGVIKKAAIKKLMARARFIHSNPYYKLRASPQLECWNAGILEEWVLGYWTIGLMVHRRRNDKIKNG